MPILMRTLANVHMPNSPTYTHSHDTHPQTDVKAQTHTDTQAQAQTHTHSEKQRQKQRHRHRLRQTQTDTHTLIHPSTVEHTNTNTRMTTWSNGLLSSKNCISKCLSVATDLRGKSMENMMSNRRNTDEILAQIDNQMFMKIL